MASSKGGSDDAKPKVDPLTCGLIMPISAIDGCSAEHWTDVRGIITQAVEANSDPKFNVKLVSDADDIGVIQKRIVQNVYTSDIVVCDVSGKNPNVMFELGLRLAFDKPTIIVKDDKTDYSFDTGIIEHIAYPRDLHFHKIVLFKTLLAEKISATHKAAKADPNHSTFLKSFGKFHVASLNQDEIPADKVVVEMFSELQAELGRLRRTLQRTESRNFNERAGGSLSTIVDEFAKYLSENPNSRASSLVDDVDFIRTMEDRCNAPRHFESPTDFKAALRKAAQILTPTK